MWGIFHGTPGKIRTYDLWLRKPTLYPAELRVHVAALVMYKYTSQSCTLNYKVLPTAKGQNRDDYSTDWLILKAQAAHNVVENIGVQLLHRQMSAHNIDNLVTVVFGKIYVYGR